MHDRRVKKSLISGFIINDSTDLIDNEDPKELNYLFSVVCLSLEIIVLGDFST